MHLLTLLSLILSAQTANPPAAPAPPSVGSPSIAYETATFPKDREQAWAMLRAANGLGDDTLQPWSLHAHYETYDAYGKPKGEGVLEYTRAGSKKWHESFTEEGRTWEQWGTEKGSYTPLDQNGALSYQASLILHEYIAPLGKDVKTPTFFAPESFGPATLACFTQVAPTDYNFDEPNRNTFKRVCADTTKPALLFTQGAYNDFFEQTAVFQHRLTAKHIVVKDGPDPVVEIFLDSLRTADAKELSSLEPPLGAVLSDLPQTSVVGHRLKSPAPFYPTRMKDQRIQGTVRLAGTINKDGTFTVKDVLHSPALELTNAAIDAVKYWTYAPTTLDGKPVALKTQVTVFFALDHR